MPPPSLAVPPRVVFDDLRRMHLHLLIVAGILLAVEAVSLALGLNGLSRLQPDWPQIYPYTVAGAGALVLAMALLRHGGAVATWTARGLAGVTLVLGVGADWAVSAGILPSADAANGTSNAWAAALPSVAASVTAAAVLLIPTRSPVLARIRFWATAGAGVITLLIVLSYVYGSTSLFLGLGATGTSLPAAVIGLVIIGAVLSARPDQPPLVELDQRYDRGLLRWMLPLLVLVPFLPAAIGWVVAPLVDDPAARAAITQLITVVILVTVIVLMGSGTSRARREVALQRQRLWEAFEHAPAATAVVSVDGRITTANHALARLTHRPSDALVGTFAYDLVADQDHATVALALAEVAAGRSGFRRDVRFRGPSTISTWVDLSIAPVRHSNGEVTYLILQCTDLSDRRQLERALQDPQVTSGRPVPAPDEPGSPQPRYPSRSGR